MSSTIKMYVYRIFDGLFMYEYTNNPDYALIDLGDDKDFTLAPPPDSEHQWRWIDNKWVADDTAE
ncbi:MAG: hypothetical protein ACTIKC_06795 [Psychrobacter sp.]